MIKLFFYRDSAFIIFANIPIRRIKRLNSINKIFTSVIININANGKMLVPVSKNGCIICIFYNYISNFFAKFFFIICCYFR